MVNIYTVAFLCAFVLEILKEEQQKRSQLRKQHAANCPKKNPTLLEKLLPLDVWPKSSKRCACPVCRKDFIWDTGVVATLPTNADLNNILKRVSRKTRTKQCTLGRDVRCRNMKWVITSFLGAEYVRKKKTSPWYMYVGGHPLQSTPSNHNSIIVKNNKTWTGRRGKAMYRAWKNLFYSSQVI